MRMTDTAARVWPDTAYTGVDAWELRSLLDAERPCAAWPAESGEVALTRPYAREAADGAVCG
jgi:hypothetical protein